MATILFDLELIATDKIVETTGTELTGDFVGQVSCNLMEQTKTKVNDLLGRAKGSVLFIDEAYTIGQGQFGEEAMTTLLCMFFY